MTFALIILLFFILIYVIIIEIFTVLFRMTGLTKAKAHFQVISMLTNSGFTTNESEMIVSSPKRRTLAMATMIFGYTNTVIIVSLLINFITTAWKIDKTDIFILVGYLAGFLTLLLLVKRVSWLREAFDRSIRNIGYKTMFADSINPIMVLEEIGNHVLCEVTVTQVPNNISEITIYEAGFRRKYNVTVMAITRRNITNVTISGNESVESGDKLLMFGPLKEIKMLFAAK